MSSITNTINFQKAIKRFRQAKPIAEKAVGAEIINHTIPKTPKDTGRLRASFELLDWGDHTILRNAALDPVTGKIYSGKVHNAPDWWVFHYPGTQSRFLSETIEDKQGLWKLIFAQTLKSELA